MNAIENSTLERLASAPAKKQDRQDATRLDQNDFLELMLAQVRHQDPFKPMQNGEFLAQMAQFSTVSGIQEMQDSLTQLGESLYANQALQASGLVGHSVVLPSSSGLLPEEGSLKGFLELPAGTSKVVVNVLDEAGSVIRTIDLGAQSAGMAEFVWDGKDSGGQQMPAAAYRIQAQAAQDGKMVAVNTLLSAKVEGVTIATGTGGLVLNLSDGSRADFKDVRQIM
ncbi:MAG: flagellar hook assembly protein FlgD [Gammaproteobacteria bacterium]